MKKSFRKTAAFVLALTLVAGCAPANVEGFLTGGTAIVAKADYVSGSLIVGDTSVTGTTSGTGWSFDAGTTTLTLNDANITPSNLANGIRYIGSDTLKIVLVGTNTIDLSNSQAYTTVGIFSLASVVISGEGSLTVKGKAVGIAINNDLTISGGTVTAVGGYGVYASGVSTVGADANVTAIGDVIAFYDKVKNANAGKGWTNVEGTDGEATIDVSTTGQTVSSTLKKVQFTAPAALAPVTYQSATVNETTNEVTFTNKTCNEYTPVTSSTSAVTWGNAETPTWYVVNSTVQIDELITVQGTVNLILADGAQLTAQKGITFVFGTLNIYAQSTGDAMGKLIANGVDYPAIYGNNLTINGGNVTANGFSNSEGPAGPGIRVDDLKINGGIVTATGGNGQYAETGIRSERFTMNGGTVTATGGNGSDHAETGIRSTNFTMNGGTVTATGGNGSDHAETGIRSTNFTMNGGTVTATGGNGPDGYGIRYSQGGSATFNGGTVIATGGAEGKVGISEGNLVLGTGVKLYGSDTETPPTTELTDTTTRFRYMRAAGSEQQGGGDPSSTTINDGSHCVVKAGDTFKVGGEVTSIELNNVALSGTYSIPANTVFTASLAENGNLVISGGELTALNLGGWSDNSAKTYFVMYYNGTLTFIENKVHNSKLNNVYIELTLGDVLAPGASFQSTGTYYFQKDNGEYAEYGNGVELSVGAEGLIQGVADINFADNKNAFVFDHIDSGKYYFNQTHIDLGATVATPPTAVTGLTYDGTAHDLLATAGTANENSQMQYSLSNVIELTADTTLNIDNVKVGCVYHPAENKTISLPEGYEGKISLYFNGHHVYFYVDEERSIKDFFEAASDNGLTGDSLRVTKVDTNSKKIYFDFVSVSDYANCWGTAIPNAKNAGDYTVYYKAVRASDSTESVIGSVDVTIEKANPTATTTPTAKTDLKYTGQPQALINAGAATGGTMEYRDTTLIPKASSETLAVNDVKIGNVYKPTGDAKISFPTGYAVSFYADTTLNTYTAETNTVYSFKFNGTDTNNPYIEIYKDTAEVSMTYFPGDALRIQAIDQSSKTIMFEVVNSADADNWSTTIPQGSYAGDYTVYYKVKGDANHNDTDAVQITGTKIEKGDPLKTKPTAKTGLTNRTTPVQLINAGVPQENCKIEYALGTQTQSDGVWKESASEITATEKGTFYVWYKVTSNNANYADFTATEPIPVTVSQYVAPTTSKSSQTWTLTMDSYAYDGTAHTPTIDGTTRGTVTYTYYNADTDEELDEAPSAIGNYKVKVYASGNNAYNSKSLIKTYSITDPIDKNGMANVDAFKANGTVPASDGKIFAGWFTDSTCQTAYTEKTGKAYAKFIDEKILTVKAQISSGTTASSASTSIRFITSVDSLKYQNVGFKITFNGKTIDQKMTKVYTAINANGAKVKPTVFSADSHYMEAYTLNNIPKDAFGKTFTVTPYYTTQDGTIVDGATNTFTIANMIK